MNGIVTASIILSFTGIMAVFSYLALNTPEDMPELQIFNYFFTYLLPGIIGWMGVQALGTGHVSRRLIFNFSRGYILLFILLFLYLIFEIWRELGEG